MFKKIMTSAAVASLAIVPVAAHAADASSLSVAKSVRASASAKKGENLAGGGFIVAALAAAAVVAGIIIVADNDDDADSN